MPPKRPLVSDDEDAYDDLDELMSSDEEEIKPGDIKQILKGSLSAAHHRTMTMKTLHEWAHTGRILLDAEYQREVVWSEAKQIALIQSMFLNFFVPSLIFAVEEDPITGLPTLVCIDGKQRCTSIRNFMDGSIPFVSPTTKVKYWWTKYGNAKRGMQLPELLKRQFESKIINTAEYERISDTQQRDIFQRVQMGMSLSGAEKLQAIAGPWPTWINELVKKYVNEPDTLGTIGGFDWDTARGRPFQALAGFIIMAHDPSRTTIPSAHQTTSFLERRDPPDNHFKRKVQMTMSLLINIVAEHFAESIGTVNKRVAPAEICYIALLIFTRMGVMSIARLASSIGRMRTYIRHDKGHLDVRSNTRVSTDFAAYIRNLPKTLQTGEEPAAEEFEADDVDPRDTRAAKRARRGEETDPTYRATAVDRYDEAGLGNATRGAKAAKTNAPAPVASSSRPIVQSHAPQPAPPPARPSATGMDRTGEAQMNGSLGQASQSSSSRQPYTTQHPQDQSQQQAYRTNALPPAQPRAYQQNYTAEQRAQLQAMHQHQQRQQQQQSQHGNAPRWTPRQ